MKKKFESNFKYKETAIYYCQQCLQPCEEEYDRVHAARNQRTILNITDETGTVADMWNNLQSFESTQFTERQCENNCGNIFHVGSLELLTIFTPMRYGMFHYFSKIILARNFKNSLTLS